MTNEGNYDLRLHLAQEPPIENPIPWPDPTPDDLIDPRFEAIWHAISQWDIAVPQAYHGYSPATGNHVKAILTALRAMSVEPI